MQRAESVSGDQEIRVRGIRRAGYQGTYVAVNQGNKIRGILVDRRG